MATRLALVATKEEEQALARCCAVALFLALDPAAPGDAANPSTPDAINNGDAVAECAWPSVVALYSDNGAVIERCTGTYIGGNVVLTAAHCVTPPWEMFDIPCQIDADCPPITGYEDPLDLECDPAEFTCSVDDNELSNKIQYARFGNTYPGNEDDGEIRKAIPIVYCRQRTTSVPAELDSDIAYCILAEKPNVQAIPVMMHCEADQFLTPGAEVAAVGFGVTQGSPMCSGSPATGGTK